MFTELDSGRPELQPVLTCSITELEYQGHDISMAV